MLGVTGDTIIDLAHFRDSGTFNNTLDPANRVLTPRGGGPRVGVITDDYIKIAARDRGFNETNEISAFVAIDGLIETGAANGIVEILDPLETAAFPIRLTSASGKMRWRVPAGGRGEAPSTIDTDLTTVQPETYLGTYSTTEGQFLYRNGVEASSNASNTGDIDNTLDGEIWFGQTFGGASSFPGNQIWEMGAVWNRALTAREAILLTGNPWAIIEPRRRIFSTADQWAFLGGGIRTDESIWTVGRRATALADA